MSLPIALAALLSLVACDSRSQDPAAGSQPSAPPASRPRPPEQAPKPASQPQSRPTKPEPFTNLTGQPAPVAHVTVLLRDPVTGDLGAASLCSCPGGFPILIQGEAGAGLVVNANKPNTAWSAAALAAMRGGEDPAVVVARLVAEDANPNIRQFLAFDRQGRTGYHSGHQVVARVLFESTPEQVVMACGMTSSANPKPVFESAVESLQQTQGLPMPERLLMALDAIARVVERGGVPPGGLMRLLQTRTAGMLVLRQGGNCDGRGDRMVDLRIETSDDPVGDLKAAYKVWLLAVLHPRLLQMQKEIDSKSPMAEANRAWLLRLRNHVELGQR